MADEDLYYLVTREALAEFSTSLGLTEQELQNYLTTEQDVIASDLEEGELIILKGRRAHVLILRSITLAEE